MKKIILNLIRWAVVPPRESTRTYIGCEPNHVIDGWYD